MTEEQVISSLRDNLNDTMSLSFRTLVLDLKWPEAKARALLISEYSVFMGFMCAILIPKHRELVADELRKTIMEFPDWSKGGSDE